ncbi:hypothetical protein [Bacillus pseudomycoides]|uniref:hypothetical protein n=1 Tax=Bacillus pseudomycoides TaxID=64104 RepID=UPI000BF0DCB0|nr:hypothetical protein [Bacillus pseudomycoides]PEJ33171.1 hypothetical protein CN677_16120 [Bacillus pseudomycoides]PHA95729.1 hypothetical protein COE78_08725 [Bacillus pseudomycoides]PHC74058.1 hypothetical protein COF38_18040 [Bacillus pseudomycoides]
MWGQVVSFIVRNASRVLNWARGVWSAVKYSRFAKAVADGAGAIAEYCTRFPNDCIQIMKMFL